MSDLSDMWALHAHCDDLIKANEAKMPAAAKANNLEAFAGLRDANEAFRAVKRWIVARAAETPQDAAQTLADDDDFQAGAI